MDKSTSRNREEGFMLVALIVAIFIILLVLGVAAPTVAKQLRREREVEAIHRGNEYVRAVQVYYRKNQHYPASIAQLEKSNNVRYLRQRYVDPMTGKPDWKLIHVGEAKTTVKGFFGKPLSGLNASSGLGSAAGSASAGAIGAGAAGSSGSSGSTFGSSSFGSSGSGPGGSGSSGSTFGSGGSGSGGSTFGSSGSSGSSSFGSAGSNTVGSSGSGSSGISSQSATSFTGGGAPIMGITSAATGSSIVVLNEQTSYPTWEFIYDPRIEAMKSKTNLLGGGGGSSSGLGSSSTGTGTGFGSSSGSGFGSSSGSGFGSSSPGSGSSFGGTSTSGSSFGSSGSTGTPAAPTSGSGTPSSTPQ